MPDGKFICAIAAKLPKYRLLRKNIYFPCFQTVLLLFTSRIRTDLHILCKLLKGREEGVHNNRICITYEYKIFLYTRT